MHFLTATALPVMLLRLASAAAGVLICCTIAASETPRQPTPPPRLDIVGQWQVRVLPFTHHNRPSAPIAPGLTTLTVAPAALVSVKDERHDSLPPFDNNAAPWSKGLRLQGLITMETTAPDMLVPESVVVKSGPGASAAFKMGVDYALEGRWATLGRLPGGAIGAGQAVWIDYQYGRGRIDSIIAGRRGKISLLTGVPDVGTPQLPQLNGDARRLANIWVPGRLQSLTPDNLYPILEPEYPEPAITGPPPAETLLPRTWARLQAGQPLHIIAWGDSVTAGGQASDEAHRYQNRFASLLQARFPKATIGLTTVAWGGRNSDSFLKEPPGSAYNFKEKVLDAHPDLIVMEFVNDAYLSPEQVEQRYASLLQQFHGVNAEWIILTPHYVWPEWMASSTVRIESDPRPYVAGVRQFAAKHHVALADASLRWGHLLKEGIPYVTLLKNSLNHPNDQGHEMFAQSLMELFGPGHH